jgi:zinc protease
VIHSINLPAHQPRILSLENGFQALLKPDPAAPIVSLQVWVRTGSIHEDAWLGAGLSHLLEHMLFNGTERRGSRQISEDVQAAGAYINAYTSFDRTVYWIETPPESTADCLDILADMTLHSTLPEDEFRKELDVIRREMAMGEDSPGSVVSKLLFATAFQKHPCRHPVIGHRQVFDQLSHDDLTAFYRRHYVPNNMFLVAAGPFDEEDMALRIESLFGAVPRAPRGPVMLPLEPRQQGQRVVFQQGSTQQTHLRLAWHAPHVTDPNAGALDLVASILGSGHSSRLYQKLREERHLVQSIGAYYYAMGDLGLFIVGAEVDPDKVEAAQEGILQEIERIREDGITEAERSKALNSALSEALDSLTTTRGVASDIGSSWMLTGSPEFTRVFISGIQDTTVEQLRHVCRTFLDPAHATIVALTPKTDRSGPLIHVPTAAARDTEKRTLSNGLTLLLKQDDRLPLVSVRTASRGGSLVEPDGVPGVTRLFSRLLAKDTTQMSAAQITDRIESAGGSFGNFSGGNSFGLEADAMAPDWELALQTVAAGLTIPAFLAPVLDKEKQAQLASIRSDQDRPMTIASILMRQALFAGHPYQFPLSGTEESVTAVTREHLLSLHQTCVTAANTVLAVYGDIDPDAVAARAETLFAPLPHGERLFSAPVLAPAISGTVRREQTYAKEQAVVLFAYPTAGLYDPDSLALELMADACSDMSSRFFNRIREDLGAAYSVGASRLLGVAGGCFYFYAATSAEMANEVEEALRGEIDILARNGLESAEFVRAKRSWHGSHKNRLQSTSGQAGIHCLDEVQGFGWNHANLQPGLMDALDNDRLRETARRHFLDRPHVVVRLLPEA